MKLRYELKYCEVKCYIYDDEMIYNLLYNLLIKNCDESKKYLDEFNPDNER